MKEENHNQDKDREKERDRVTTKNSSSGESLTQSSKNKNKYIKYIIISTTFCLILSMIASIAFFFLRDSIITFHYINEYFPFQTNVITLIIIILIQICILLINISFI